jgi:hypothetical protein
MTHCPVFVARYSHERLELFTAVKLSMLKMTVFWDVAPSSLVEIDVEEVLTASIIALMIQPVSTTETSVNFYHTHGATSQKTVILKLT